ncbi:Endo-1,4-beta-xylanase B [Posidoniimonas corsicana]|uniref:Beta-xylanase n=1 Tax=Posidoniimonas corsicana TaxID=1938618 RepID=A0A5C5VHZ5_9BACT|nr:endo-1,4-beta-xylanase [Posidoniimonas corsicana]TWT38264.1 Endo-1,4-beta-xylanase B [Posidoniimonas corsicana]
MLRSAPAVVLLLAAAVVCRGDEFVLSDFDGAGFSYTYGGFEQQSDAGSVRLYDPADGWGAGVVNQTLDLSGFADGRLVVDFTPNAAHGTDFFLVQLNDASGLSGRWNFNASGYTPGEPVRLTSLNTLAEPDAVYDGSGFVDTPPDLSQITNWAVEGQWASPEPFDLTFDNLLVSTDAPPPPPYEGHAPDAPWRAEAAARIDAVRKADLTVRVTDASGAEVAGAGVRVRQQSHAFGFGSAVQAVRLRDNNPVHDDYKDKVAELFNIATIENNLKWPPWEGEWGSNFTRAGAAQTLDWLESHGIAARGHVLVWPGESNLPADVRSLLAGAPLNTAEQQQLRDRVAGHIADLAGEFSGRIGWWDVVNEPRANHDIMDNLPEGDAAMAEWFQLAAAAAPDARLYLNEYGILTSGGGVDTSNQRLLEDQLEALIDAGAPVDGVGLQGHFSDASLTGPERLWQIVDRYADLGLDVQVTEFDYNTTDEQLQAEYLRDFMTAMFAHEGVSDVVMWGFWEDAHFAPDAALFRSDWSIKPNGQAFIDLVFGEWWTDESLATNDQGEASLRAFKGQQLVTVTWAGAEHVAQVQLAEDGTVESLTLPFLLGDYNADGSVDAADYTVWRDALGNSVAAPGQGADGNGDGQVTQADYQVWRMNYGARLPAAGVGAVPEPAAWLLAPAAWAALAIRRRRR